MIEPVDRLDVHVLVDNTTDSLSSVPAGVESEFSYLARRGMRMLAGRCLCCASHGLSCLITAHRGSAAHTMLFDSGPDGEVFAHNVDRLSLDLGIAEGVVLSHGHWDHAGGMLCALELIRAGNGGRGVPYYAHPAMFRSRARQLPNGDFMPMEDVPDVAALTTAGAHVVQTTAALSLLDDMFFVSGEIPRVTTFEQGLPFHFQRSEDGQRMEPDPWLIDERWLAVNVAGKGMVVFTACSHAGVVNVLTHARDLFPDGPLHAVVGGFHLAGPMEKIIPETVDALRTFDLARIAAGHCTGWRAMAALAQTFGDRVVVPIAVGKRLTF